MPVFSNPMRIYFENTELGNDLLAERITSDMLAVVAACRVALEPLQYPVEAFDQHRIVFIADRQDPRLLIENIDDEDLVKAMLMLINSIDYESIFSHRSSQNSN